MQELAFQPKYVAMTKGLCSDAGHALCSAGSLRRIALVCCAWHGCATESLYADVDLWTEPVCVERRRIRQHTRSAAITGTQRPALIILDHFIDHLPILYVYALPAYRLSDEMACSDYKAAVDDVIACRAIHIPADSGTSQISTESVIATSTSRQGVQCRRVVTLRPVLPFRLSDRGYAQAMAGLDVHKHLAFRHHYRGSSEPTSVETPPCPGYSRCCSVVRV